MRIIIVLKFLVILLSFFFVGICENVIFLLMNFVEGYIFLFFEDFFDYFSSCEGCYVVYVIVWVEFYYVEGYNFGVNVFYEFNEFFCVEVFRFWVFNVGGKCWVEDVEVEGEVGFFEGNFYFGFFLYF